MIYEWHWRQWLLRARRRKPSNLVCSVERLIDEANKSTLLTMLYTCHFFFDVVVATLKPVDQDSVVVFNLEWMRLSWAMVWCEISFRFGVRFPSWLCDHKRSKSVQSFERPRERIHNQKETHAEISIRPRKQGQRGHDGGGEAVERWPKAMKVKMTAMKTNTRLPSQTRMTPGRLQIRIPRALKASLGPGMNGYIENWDSLTITLSPWPRSCPNGGCLKFQVMDTCSMSSKTEKSGWGLGNQAALLRRKTIRRPGRG